MNAYLDAQNNPHLKLEVLFSSPQKVDCLIDTGFSGGLALPESYLANFKTQPIAYQEYELADGSFTTFAIYKTKVRFQDINKEITLFFTKSNESLVGIEFLIGFKFVLDLKKLSVDID